ncbi:MAG: glycerol kinase GlpK [Deltaproteobacteria bacterium]|nr:glycerol kinase GlpK [Myxococcales bacterium]MDP3217186.1 glycerol kinase GlpK [Deltaproteobacteria bacterium]
MAETILAIDQGTTGTTALLLDTRARVLGRATVPVPQHFPRPGMVEHDAEEIWATVVEAIAGALAQSNRLGSEVRAIGITNQRETTLLWHRATGVPVHRAIVWQDRRTASECDALRARGVEALVYERAGLLVDPYFSGTKIGWLLDHVEGARAQAVRGDLAFGTIDTWLVHKLTGGAHVTDVSNASRTMLLGLRSLAWDDELLGAFDVPRAVLPEVVSSAGIVGKTRGVPGLPDGIPIAGIAGDQQAALFGQGCFRVGDVKCTYGTGAFVLMNVGSTPLASKHRLLTTVGWRIPGEVVYALEGSAFIAGAAVQWLRDGLGIIRDSAEIEGLAGEVDDAGEVVFVPALTGLGAPHWAPRARGLIAGLGRDTTRAHLARAALEGIAMEIADLVAAMSADAGAPIASMRVDGGASANGLMMQIQADVTGTSVVRPRVLETTALGAGMLAALGAGLVGSRDDIAGALPVERSFAPGTMSDERVAALRSRWKTAVARALLEQG